MKKLSKDIKRRLRNRKKLKKVSVNRYRLSIFKSLKNISAQIIDDKVMKTLVSASSGEKEIKNKKAKKIDVSNLLGELLARRAKEKKIENIYFDRGKYKYHGTEERVCWLIKKERISLDMNETEFKEKLAAIIKKLLRVVEGLVLRH